MYISEGRKIFFQLKLHYVDDFVHLEHQRGCLDQHVCLHLHTRLTHNVALGGRSLEEFSSQLMQSSNATLASCVLMSTAGELVFTGTR